MSRFVEEWRGKTDDSPIPDRVKLRIWNRCDGRCHLTGRKIQIGDAYDFDHIKALADEGEHREFNIAPALRSKHREKTSEENSLRAKADRKAAKHLGFKSKGRGWNKNLRRRMDGTVEPRDARSNATSTDAGPAPGLSSNPIAGRVG